MGSFVFDHGDKYGCHLFNTSDIKALSQWGEKKKNWSATTSVVFEILDSRF